MEELLSTLLRIVTLGLIRHYGEEKAKTVLDDSFVQTVNALTRAQLDERFGPKPKT